MVQDTGLRIPANILHNDLETLMTTKFRPTENRVFINGGIGISCRPAIAASLPIMAVSIEAIPCQRPTFNLFVDSMPDSAAYVTRRRP